MIEFCWVGIGLLDGYGVVGWVLGYWVELLGCWVGIGLLGEYWVVVLLLGCWDGIGLLVGYSFLGGGCWPVDLMVLCVFGVCV